MQESILNLSTSGLTGRDSDGVTVRMLSARLLAGLPGLCLLAASPLAAQLGPEVVLILDVSGSMWGRMQNEPKIAGARRVVKELLAGLPAESSVGLLAYGHRRKSDCADIEVLLPPGNKDKTAIGKQLDSLNPVGMTPITQAIEEAIGAVRARKTAGRIVLVTDGLETCGRDPCRAVRAAKLAGTDFLLHVIGFDVAKENVSSLECAAQAGGGLYLAADDVAALSDALKQTVAAGPSGNSTLAVKVMLDGKLQDASVRVRDARGTIVASGRTYQQSETNPRRFPLEAGTYRLLVDPVGVRGSMSREVAGIVVAKGKVTEHVVDLGSGEIAVRVTRNGALSDANVWAYLAGTDKRVAGGRTYRAATSNPIVLRLPPGEYDVEISGLEVAGGATNKLTKLVVAPGGRVDREHEFRTGRLAIGTVNAGSLVDCTITVKDPTGKVVVSGRTYVNAKSNPRSFDLAPGKYTVSAGAVALPGRPQRDIAVEVQANGNAEYTIDFAR